MCGVPGVGRGWGAEGERGVRDVVGRRSVGELDGEGLTVSSGSRTLSCSRSKASCPTWWTLSHIRRMLPHSRRALLPRANFWRVPACWLRRSGIGELRGGWIEHPSPWLEVRWPASPLWECHTA